MNIDAGWTAKSTESVTLSDNQTGEQAKWEKHLCFVVVMYSVPLSKSYNVCEQACRLLHDFVFICIYLLVIYLLHFYQR